MNHSATAPLTVDHRSAMTFRGRPTSEYRRIERAARPTRVAASRSHAVRDGSDPSRTARSEPNYVARRLAVLVTAVAAVLVVASALDAVLVSFGGDPAFADETVPAAETAAAVHVAGPGDSLWSIADEYRGDVAHDRYVRALITLNGSTTIIVGQAVALP